MKTLSIEEVRGRLRKAVSARGSQIDWAMENGVSQGHLSRVLSGYRDPGATVLNALGLEKIVGYRQKRNGKAA